MAKTTTICLKLTHSSFLPLFSVSHKCLNCLQVILYRKINLLLFFPNRLNSLYKLKQRIARTSKKLLWNLLFCFDFHSNCLMASSIHWQISWWPANPFYTKLFHNCLHKAVSQLFTQSYFTTVYTKLFHNCFFIGCIYQNISTWGNVLEKYICNTFNLK